jgi:hypothetical protein
MDEDASKRSAEMHEQPPLFLDLVRRHSNVVMFAAGFLFDLATMRRIDAWTDLAIQLFYLAAITMMLIWMLERRKWVA